MPLPLPPPSTTVTSPSPLPLPLLFVFLGYLTRIPTTFRHNYNRLQNWRYYYGYTFQIVTLIATWNLAVAVVIVATILLTVGEKPNVPVRFWLIGKSVQRAVYALLLFFEYKRSTRRVVSENVNSGSSIFSGVSVLSRLGELNTYFVSNWWRMGAIWLGCGGETLELDAPCLYWLTKAVLLPDMFFGFLDLLSDYLRALSYLSVPLSQQRAASLAEINILPKYGFEVSNDEKLPDGKLRRMVPMGTNGPAFSSVRFLPVEDSRCCICLCKYKDGAKLNSLPCKHHFHAACVFTWLRIKATCPLCKKVIY